MGHGGFGKNVTSRINSLAHWLWIVLAAAMLCATPSHAQRTNTPFDHLATGFPLTGAHFTVDCASCHVNGRFRGTPRQCAGCHNGTIAAGKPAQHVRTTNVCEGCHVPVAWRELHYDHTQANGPCALCHNGTIARGKPATHLTTNAPCET